MVVPPTAHGTNPIAGFFLGCFSSDLATESRDLRSDAANTKPGPTPVGLAAHQQCNIHTVNELFWINTTNTHSFSSKQAISECGGQNPLLSSSETMGLILQQL